MRNRTVEKSVEKCISCGEKGMLNLRYGCGKESVKKLRKKWKKVLTNRGGFANISKRSATGQNRSGTQAAQRVRGIESLKKVWKTWKKFLTKWTECGNLIKSAARPTRDNLEERRMKELQKKFEKTWKKFLTKRKRCVIIKNRRDKFAAVCTL